MPASSLNIRQILTEHFGKKPDDLWYVLADEYIDNVIDKFRSYLRKHEYILVVNENKFHILKLQTKANQTQIIEQYTYAISLLKNISIKEIGQYGKSKAKAITFTDPDGDKHKFRVPIDVLPTIHSRQTAHLKEIIKILVPTD